MRIPGFLVVFLLLVVDVSRSQVEIPSSQTAGLPMFRPALIGTGRQALINRIDTAQLIKDGQKDAAIMFSCTVKKNGDVDSASTYRGTPDSNLLQQEVLRQLSAAAQPKFIPAVYNHLPVDAVYYGTVSLMVVDGKPRLRIFSNQETEDLKKESDFISPQPFRGGESKFTGFHYPSTEEAPVSVDAAVELMVRVDASGNLQQLRLLTEKPPFLGFGPAALNNLSQAKFIPGFRDGKPVSSVVKLTVYYKAQSF